MMNKGLKYFIFLLVVAVAVVVTLLVYNPFSSDNDKSPLPLLGSSLLPDSGQRTPDQAGPSRQPADQTETTEAVVTQEMVQEREAKLRQEIIRKRREADALDARKHAAFMKWWHAPPWCLEEEGMKVLVQCSDLKRAKRAQFENLLAEGKITLPPVAEEATTTP